MWDGTTGEPVRSFSGPADRPHNVAIGPDGRLLVIGGGDGAIRLWGPETGRLIGTLTGHAGSVNALAFSPDGRRLLSGSTDATVKVWDVEGGLEVVTFRSFEGPVYALAVSPDGQQVAVGGAFATNLRLLDAAPGGGADGRAARLAWHLREVTWCETYANWFGADFHRTWAIEADPDNGEHFRARGTARYRMGRFADAVADYTRAIERKAGDAFTLLYRGDACRHLGRLDAALPDLSRAIAELPMGEPAARSAGFYYRGDVYARRGEWDRAAADFAAALALAPGYLEARTAAALVRLRRSDRAGYRVACADLLARVEGPTLVPILQDVARTCVLAPDVLPDPGKLAVRMEKGARIAPSDPARRFLLGAALYRAGRYREAADRLAEARWLDRENAPPELHLFAAMARYRLGQTEQARRLLAEAAPALPEADWQARLARDLLGREAEALVRPEGR